MNLHNLPQISDSKKGEDPPTQFKHWCGFLFPSSPVAHYRNVWTYPSKRGPNSNGTNWNLHRIVTSWEIARNTGEIVKRRSLCMTYLIDTDAPFAGLLTQHFQVEFPLCCNDILMRGIRGVRTQASRALRMEMLAKSPLNFHGRSVCLKINSLSKWMRKF